MLWASSSSSFADRARVGGVGDVEDLDPLLVADVAVAELGLERPGLVEELAADDRGHDRLLGVVDRDHHQAGVAGDVGVGPEDRDVVRPVEDVAGVEGDLALEEVIQRVAVDDGRRRRR